MRVTSVTPALGANVSPGPVLGITSTAPQVTIELSAAQQSSVKVGDPVTITLPNNQTTPGVVSSVGTVAKAPSNKGGEGGGGGPGGGEEGGPTIEVDVALSDPGAIGHLDEAPVSVSITTASVPSALVGTGRCAAGAGAAGGYAVEVVEGRVHRLEAVTLGLFDDAEGLVQVSGAGPRGRTARGGAGDMSALDDPRSTGSLGGALAEAPPVLELRDVSKTYGAEPPVYALREVSFAVDEGELVAIVGPVGVGQDDAAARDRHARAPQRGRRRDHRPGCRRPARIASSHAAGDADRLRLPAVLPGRALDRARERGGRAARTRARTRASGVNAPPRRSHGSGSPIARASARASSQVASASAWRSRARSSAARRSCSPTSPPATSTAQPAPRSSRCSRS